MRYVAVDLSPAMLARARSRARDQDLADVELIRASADDIALPPDSADLFLSFWGLHCFGVEAEMAPEGPIGSVG